MGKGTKARVGAGPSTLRGGWKEEGALLGIGPKQRPVSEGTAAVKATAGHPGPSWVGVSPGSWPLVYLWD